MPLQLAALHRKGASRLVEPAVSASGRAMPALRWARSGLKGPAPTFFFVIVASSSGKVARRTGNDAPRTGKPAPKWGNVGTSASTTTGTRSIAERDDAGGGLRLPSFRSEP